MSDVETIARRLRIARRIMALMAFLVVASLVGIGVYGYRTVDSMPGWHNFWKIVEREKALTEAPPKQEAAP